MRLVAKLGGRWSLSVEPALGKHYGITRALVVPAGHHGHQVRQLACDQWETQLHQKMLEELQAQHKEFPNQDIYLLFGEANLGLKQTFALPGRYYGEPEYVMNEKEEAKFNRIFEQAVVTGKVLKAIKQEHPEFKHIKATFGNTSPSFHIEFLKRGLPRECIEAFGIDIPYFERMPERQPRAVEASQLWHLYEFRKQSGCEDIPIYGTEDMFYPGQPGSLSQREQADYYVRCHLLKMALGVARGFGGHDLRDLGPLRQDALRGDGLLRGRAGRGRRRQPPAGRRRLRHHDPPSRRRQVPQAPPRRLALHVLPGLQVKIRPGRRAGPVDHPRAAQVAPALDRDAAVRVTDAMGNTLTAASAGSVLALKVDSAAVGRRADGRAGQRRAGRRAGLRRAACRALRRARRFPRALACGSGTAGILRGEQFRFAAIPRGHADLAGCRLRRRPGHAGRPRQAAEGQETGPLVRGLHAAAADRAARQAEKIGLYVKGHSGWGRVIPQLTDAKGELWTFVGPKDEWNSDDIYSQSSVNFDGWKYMEMPLPTNLPNGWPGPAMGFWKNEKGDRIVDYPLRLTKLIVEQRTHVYYVNEDRAGAGRHAVVGKTACSHEDPYQPWHFPWRKDGDPCE